MDEGLTSLDNIDMPRFNLQVFWELIYGLEHSLSRLRSFEGGIILRTRENTDPEEIPGYSDIRACNNTLSDLSQEYRLLAIDLENQYDN